MLEKKGISRRGFVGAALVGTMGVAASSFLTGCSAPAATEGKTTDTWTEEVDVVVIGSGAAGHAAALEAAGAGASVLMLEKSGATGGDSALCDGILGGWGTKLAKEQGITLTADEVYDWFTAHPDWYGPFDPEVTRLNADKCGETIDWLQEIGVPFEAAVGPKFGYTELPAIHQVEGKGVEMMRVLAENAEKAGVKTTTDTRATKLITNEDGRIIGIEALTGKEAVRFKANKGVVMALGGYSGNPEMLVTLSADSANILPGSTPGNTGDGIAMAAEIGALTSRTSNAPLMTSLAGLESKSIVNINYGMRLNGIWLDANGARFFDDSTPYENPTGHRAILHKQNTQGKPVVLLLPTTPSLEAYMTKMPLNWAKGTVEEVAAAVGLDPLKVKTTVDRYNEFCSSGKDEEFGTPAEFLIPLAGPFYAANIAVSTSVTVGGLKTNTDAQALKLKNPAKEGALLEPIPGLYAAGVACEWNCAAGWTVLSAMTLGRIAGQSVAKEKPVA